MILVCITPPFCPYLILEKLYSKRLLSILQKTSPFEAAKAWAWFCLDGPDRPQTLKSYST